MAKVNNDKRDTALVNMLKALDGEKVDITDEDTKAMFSNLNNENQKEANKFNDLMSGISEQLKKEKAVAYKRALEQYTAEAIEQARHKANREFGISDSDKAFLDFAKTIAKEDY